VVPADARAGAPSLVAMVAVAQALVVALLPGAGHHRTIGAARHGEPRDGESVPNGRLAAAGA
jgi:hypothetical protein